jgi:hypothetical protein
MLSIMKNFTLPHHSLTCTNQQTFEDLITSIRTIRELSCMGSQSYHFYGLLARSNCGQGFEPTFRALNNAHFPFKTWGVGNKNGITADALQNSQ